MIINKTMIGDVYEYNFGGTKGIITIIDVSGHKIKVCFANDNKLYDVSFSVFLRQIKTKTIVYSKEKNRIKKIESIINE